MQTDISSDKSAIKLNRLSLIALWFFFYSTVALFTPPLLDDADSVHAEVAREILLRHDWITLYANGIRYLEKAPLLYWSIAASFKLLGVHTATARLPLAFAVLALALIVEALARQAFSSTRAGLYAGVLILSSFGIFIFTRILIPDALVCLWLTIALYCYWLTEQAQAQGTPTSTQHENRGPHLRDSLLVAKVGHRAEHDPLSSTGPESPDAPSFAAPSQTGVPDERFCSTGWRRMGTMPSTPHPNPFLCWAFAACCALNVLTKGLIGIVFPILIVLSHLALTRRNLQAVLARIKQLAPISSTIVFFAIAAPWHIFIALATPAQRNPDHITFTHRHCSVPPP